MSDRITVTVCPKCGGEAQRCTINGKPWPEKNGTYFSWCDRCGNVEGRPFVRRRIFRVKRGAT